MDNPLSQFAEVPIAKAGPEVPTQVITQPLQPIAHDSFWDGNNFAQGSGLDPTKYHSPAEERVMGDRPMTAVIPTGAWGATGTIVKRSTEDGAPIGHNPDAVATQVIVDPDIPGQGFIFNPTEFASLQKKDQLRAAVAQAAPRQATSIEDRRFRASSVLRQFAGGGVPEQPAPQVFQAQRESPINMPGQYVVPQASPGGGQVHMQQQPQGPMGLPTQGVDVANVVQRGNDPLAPTPVLPEPAQPAMPAQPVAQGPVKAASLGTPMQPTTAPQAPVGPAPGMPVTQAPAYPPAAGTPLGMPQQPAPASLFDALEPAKAPQASAAPAPAAASAVKPPTFKLVFEIAGMPFQQEAFYHQIIRDNASLILVFDTRAVGFPKTFPMSTDADMLCQIAGQDVAYRIKTTGIQFPFLHYELCVLLITSEHPLGPPPAEEAPQIPEQPMLPPMPPAPMQ